MIKFRIVNVFVIILVSASALTAQKLKYKDIYGLLSTKQYEQAEPFLKSYLKENTDNPNAYLFMGLIYQEKSINTDVLLQTEKAIQQMDTTILYFSKALETITEKELRKNKDYYTAYNRRDLRTGEFGVKLSDVQLDLETRISSSRERIDKVKMVKHYFINTEDLYKRSFYLYQDIQKAFPGERELYLRADDEMLASLKNLSLRFDSCSKMFENYKVSLSNLGKTKYNQSWTLQDISDFKKDGSEMGDFYKDEVKVWDYKKFANQTIAVIEKEVKPTLDDLVKYDIEINKLRQRMETDSVSVKNDLVKLIEKLLNNQLKKFDQDPMPIDVFALKIADLDYRSTVIESRPIRKSNDIRAQLSAVGDELRYASRLDSVAGKVMKRPLDVDILNYDKFVTNTFSKGDILKSYIRSVHEYSEREVIKKKAEVSKLVESLKWLVVNNDSIPLTTEVVGTKFKPLLIENGRYSVGIKVDGGQGYFYNITPSHVPTIKATFALDSGIVRESTASLKAYAASDPDEQIFFVLIHGSIDASGKVKASLAKIYKSDGLSWNINLSIDFMPYKIAFIPETGAILIKAEIGDISTSVDKNGKIIPK